MTLQEINLECAVVKISPEDGLNSLSGAEGLTSNLNLEHQTSSGFPATFVNWLPFHGTIVACPLEAICPTLSYKAESMLLQYQ